MIKQLKQWLYQANAETEVEISTPMAAAALLVEVMAADDQFQQKEQTAIEKLLMETLSLPANEAEELVAEARKHHDAANDLYQLTKRINQDYDPEQKKQLVLDMWKVAYADGDLDRYEDHIIRKVAELLYVPHSQFIQAKHLAKPE